MGNVLVIRSSYSHLQGSATLVNLTGSLRWLSQSIQLDAHRLIQGEEAKRKDITHLGGKPPRGGGNVLLCPAGEHARGAA